MVEKKVKELSNEKDKWDKSIVAAAKIGLLFYEGKLPKPATKPEFVEQFGNEFEKLPKSTVEKIYQSLPAEYRNTGGSPAKEPTGVDDVTVDNIIVVSAYAGYLTNKEGLSVFYDIEERLAEDE